MNNLIKIVALTFIGFSCRDTEIQEIKQEIKPDIKTTENVAWIGYNQANCVKDIYACGTNQPHFREGLRYERVIIK